MVSSKEKIEAELENIDRLLEEVPDPETLPKLSVLELAGAGAMIHNFYNGIENVLKQITIAKGIAIDQGPSCHNDLIAKCVANRIISQGVSEMLKKYLAFRHFFSHGYSFDLDVKRMLPLLKNIKDTYNSFVKEVENALKE
jgi:uncharacterized protein YutE (UPF0331/DUF86 family)